MAEEIERSTPLPELRVRVKKQIKGNHVLYRGSLVSTDGRENVIGWFLSRKEAKTICTRSILKKEEAEALLRSVECKHARIKEWQQSAQGTDKNDHARIGLIEEALTRNDEAKEETLILDHKSPSNANTRTTKPNKAQTYSIEGIISDRGQERNALLPSMPSIKRNVSSRANDPAHEMLSPSIMVGNNTFRVLARRKQRVHKADSVAFKAENVADLVHYEPYFSGFPSQVKEGTPHTAGLHQIPRTAQTEIPFPHKSSEYVWRKEEERQRHLRHDSGQITSSFNILKTQRGGTKNESSSKNKSGIDVVYRLTDINGYTGIHKRLRKQQSGDQILTAPPPSHFIEKHTQWRREDRTPHQQLANNLRSYQSRGSPPNGQGCHHHKYSVRRMVVSPISLDTLTTSRPLKTKPKPTRRFK